MNEWASKYSARWSRIVTIALIGASSIDMFLGRPPNRALLAACVFALLSIAFDLARIAERKP